MKILLALITVTCRIFGIIECLCLIFPIVFTAILPVFLFSILLNLTMPIVKAVSPKLESEIRNIATSEIKCVAEDAVQSIMNLL